MGHTVTLFCETYADLLVEATRDAARQVDAFWAAQARQGAEGSSGREADRAGAPPQMQRGQGPERPAAPGSKAHKGRGLER